MEDLKAVTAVGQDLLLVWDEMPPVGCVWHSRGEHTEHMKPRAKRLTIERIL
jgi:hypothetical protein